MRKPVFRSVVVMGPSGNGKSTLGRALADRLDWRFIEGDEHHPPANIAKMSRGEPLTDADRQPFLHSIGDALAVNEGAVAACSALKRRYRELLTAIARRPLLFVLPQLSPARLQQRMERRTGHFMPPSLLASQLRDLEPPASPEHALLVDGEQLPERLVEQIAQHLISACKEA